MNQNILFITFIGQGSYRNYLSHITHTGMKQIKEMDMYEMAFTHVL